jgi:microcystin-dependent protein
MAGALKLANGTVSAPAASFNSASGTGLYKTTDGFGVAINGAQVAEFTAGGMTKGSRYIGELIPWTGKTAPARCVLPYGQTLSRTTYADLWAFAQLEIAAGNLFYNNGDGSTTFGIGDARGRAIAAPDIMGGSTDAARLTGSSMAATRTSVGGTGGEGLHTQSVNEMPAHSHSVNVSDPGHTHTTTITAPVWTSFGGANIGGSPNTAFQQQGLGINTAVTGIAVSINNNGSGQAFNVVQPTLLCNFALYAGA